jgi:ribosome-binding factor A
MTTVTRVEMSDDGQVAEVYFSVPGSEVEERKTLAAIKHAGGFLQRLVARELSIRQCPAIRFDIDERAKKVQQMMDLLEKNRRERPAMFEDDDGMPDSQPSVGEPEVLESGDEPDDGNRRIDE